MKFTLFMLCGKLLNKLKGFYHTYYPRLRTSVTQWLRCCAKNRKIVGSIPAGVIGIGSYYGPGVDSASNRSRSI